MARPLILANLSSRQCLVTLLEVYSADTSLRLDFVEALSLDFTRFTPATLFLGIMFKSCRCWYFFHLVITNIHGLWRYKYPSIHSLSTHNKLPSFSPQTLHILIRYLLSPTMFSSLASLSALVLALTGSASAQAIAAQVAALRNAATEVDRLQLLNDTDVSVFEW